MKVCLQLMKDNSIICYISMHGYIYIMFQENLKKKPQFYHTQSKQKIIIVPNYPKYRIKRVSSCICLTVSF